MTNEPSFINFEVFKKINVLFIFKSLNFEVVQYANSVFHFLASKFSYIGSRLRTVSSLRIHRSHACKLIAYCLNVLDRQGFSMTESDGHVLSYSLLAMLKNLAAFTSRGHF